MRGYDDFVKNLVSQYQKTSYVVPFSVLGVNISSVRGW